MHFSLRLLRGQTVRCYLRFHRSCADEGNFSKAFEDYGGVLLPQSLARGSVFQFMWRLLRHGAERLACLPAGFYEYGTASLAEHWCLPGCACLTVDERILMYRLLVLARQHPSILAI